MENFEPALKHEIDNLETIKIVSDPLRLNMLHLVTPQARTVKQVAEILRLQPHKLYYHMNTLEEHGLVKLVEQKIVGGVVEKYFRAVAEHYSMAPDLLNTPGNTPGGALGEFADFVFTQSHADLNTAITAGWVDTGPTAPYPMVLSRRMAMLTKEEAYEFTQQISDMLQDFSAHSVTDDSDEQREPYLLLSTLFRTAEMEDQENE